MAVITAVSPGVDQLHTHGIIGVKMAKGALAVKNKLATTARYHDVNGE